MTISARSSLKKMSRVKGQSSGWTAFDLKQRQKQGLESEVDRDPFPAISSASNYFRSSDKLLKNNHVPDKSFSSVLLPCKNFPDLKESGNSKSTILGCDSGGKYCITTPVKDIDLAIKKLKEQHCWAESSLIGDILAAVGNDVNNASTVLETMACSVNFEELKLDSSVNFEEQKTGSAVNFDEQNQLTIPGPTTSDNIPSYEKTDKVLSLGNAMDLSLFSSTHSGHPKDNDKNLEDGSASFVQNFSDNGNLRCNIGLLKSFPVEPEWEEDDVYISHRMNAMRVVRSASQHSKAAANAFRRGDHFSAKQHSMKAQEEWLTAEGHHVKAAKEILSIRNSENDIWRLDLHGLHAAEAIIALQEHLRRIGSQGFSKSLASSRGVKEKDGIAHSTLGSGNCRARGKLDKQHTPLRLRSSVLQVITGIGNHSQGQAALPTAVRSFLNENGYRFEEMRPGVIAVWPKFRGG